ncbi:Cytosolic seryl-tRNA synthetase [Entomophthora muscae]|uniref:Cytosolic seryl-tRNA synthetase n=1 Tax=Entomophthora muscae TaxID=34485 RepID=A0ACC2SGQ6_9FUNG|nr:Cytosolic seryl-tRNA synthetase [Entomophthora muscae]
MLDINLFLADKGGNPDLVRESQRRRGASVEIVDEIIGLYEDWTKTRFTLDGLNRDINAVQKEIGNKKKAKEDATVLLEKKNEIQQKKDLYIIEEKEKEALWKQKLVTVGNLVHNSVPVSMDEDNNAIIRTWEGELKPEKKTDILPHHAVLHRLDGYDPERGTNVAGHRGYFLTNDGVDLNLALITYGLNFLRTKNYKKIQTPYFMKKDMMARTAQLSQFDEELYKVVGDGEDKYLIATSEQPISALHAD